MEGKASSFEATCSFFHSLKTEGQKKMMKTNQWVVDPSSIVPSHKMMVGMIQQKT